MSATDPDAKPAVDNVANTPPTRPASTSGSGADWQARLRRIAWRAWIESRAIAAVTFRHALHLGRRCWLLGRRQVWRWRLHRQQLNLGEQMYQRGVGEESVRTRIQDLDQQIEAGKSDKRSVRPLNRSRKALLLQLAGGLSDSESKDVQSAAQGVQVLTRELRGLDGKLEAEGNRSSPTPAEWGQIGTGYVAIVVIAVVTVAFYAGLTSKAKAPGSTGTHATAGDSHAEYATGGDNSTVPVTTPPETDPAEHTGRGENSTSAAGTLPPLTRRRGICTGGRRTDRSSCTSYDLIQIPRGRLQRSTFWGC